MCVRFACCQRNEKPRAFFKKTKKPRGLFENPKKPIRIRIRIRIRVRIRVRVRIQRDISPDGENAPPPLTIKVA